MENKPSDKPINPSFCFRLTKVLSIVAPHLYSEKQLAEIKEIEKTILCQESSSSGFTSQHATLEEMSPPLKNKKRHCPSDEGEEDDVSYEEKKEVKSRKKKSKKNEPILSLLPFTPPTMPIEVSNRIQTLLGRDINYVMCKKLFISDLNKNLNRLSMPFKAIKSNFLTEEEKATLNTKEDGNPGSFKVTVSADPSFREFEMDFKKWEMNTTCIYNLAKSNDLVEANKLKIGEEYHIWSFRVDDKLHLLMNKKNP